ncbi:ligand-binding sensor domain-containing protein [Labilibacter marinus]|uniref:ligand-binding sensor domain-containing protein n=1 Tax=Labilibacter marinus TaxID=1477105 RepID=UPI00082CA553|nr:two-component regulator propeller domain-containing protein [Labilibacter marinus]
MKIYQFIIILCIVLIASIGINTNVLAQELPALKFEKLNTDHGLSSNQSLFIKQDNQGFLWIGSNGGTDRYDGYNLRKYVTDKKNPHAISTNVVGSFAQDYNNNIWFSSINSGIEFYDIHTERFKNLSKIQQDSKANSSSKVFIDSKKRIWSITKDEEVYMASLEEFYKDSTLNFQPINNNETNNPLTATDIKEDKTGKIWVIGKEYMAVVSFNANGKYKVELIETSGTSNIFKDDHDDLWFFANGMVNKVFYEAKNKYSIEKYDCYNSVSNKKFWLYDVSSLVIDKNETMWLGTGSRGVYTATINTELKRTDLKTHSSYDLYNADGISSNTVRRIYVDKNNIVWLALSGGGINKYDADQKQFGHIKVSNQPGHLPFKGVRKIVEDGEDNLWIGEQGAGLVVLPKTDDNGLYNNFISKTDEVFSGKRPPGPNYSIGVVSTNKFNSLYFFTWKKKIVYLDPKLNRGKKYHFLEDDKETIGKGICIQNYADKNNDLWYTHFNGGVARVKLTEDGHIDSSQVFMFDANDDYSIPNNTVRDVVHSSDNTLWVATAKGLARIKNYNKDDIDLKFETFYTNEKDSNSISNDYAICLFETQNGVLWIGTYGGGLNKFVPGVNGEPDRFKAYTEENGLSSNIVKCILEDDNGNLWITTAFGLSKFNPKTEKFRNYTKADGLQDNDFFDLSGIKRKNGQILLGGVNGFNYFYPDSIKDNPYQPKAKIVNIKINNKPGIIGQEYHKNVVLPQSISLLSEMEISYKERVIELELSSDHYANPEKNKFQYKLEPLDDEWISTTSEKRFVTYTDLRGGEYTFKVKAANGDGVWGEVTSLMITVKPPFWKTTFFIVFCILSVIVGLYFLFKWRTQKLKEDQKLLKEKVDQATAQVESRNAKLEEAKDKIAKIMQDVKNELGKASEELLNATNSQASTIEEISSSVEQMTANIKEDANNALTMHQDSKSIEEDAELSVKIVSQTVDSMENITKEISFISDFARTTNLLSLNATIEAAKAGEHGRTFAVVAGEIKKLADNSQEVADKIKGLSEAGLLQSHEANTKIVELQTVIGNVIGFIAKIRESSQTQSYETNNINSAIQQITTYINSTNQLAEKLDSAINALSVDDE